MPISGVRGSVQISLETEQALIRVLSPQDYPNTPFEQDMEVSVVHELLHISMKYFADPENCTLEHTNLEAFIERTARLLVKLAGKEKQSEDVARSGRS